MALTLIRHTTPDVAKGTCYGRTDLKLAGSFETECARVLEYLPAAAVVLTSPLTRCRLLADRVSTFLNCEVRIVNHWVEMDFGVWEGVPWSGVPRDQLDAWAADFMGYDDHGGESVSALETRVRQGLEHAPSDAIVVTHSGCIRAACAIKEIGDGWDTQIDFGGMITL